MDSTIQDYAEGLLWKLSDPEEKDDRMKREMVNDFIPLKWIPPNSLDFLSHLESRFQRVFQQKWSRMDKVDRWDLTGNTALKVMRHITDGTWRNFQLVHRRGVHKPGELSRIFLHLSHLTVWNESYEHFRSMSRLKRMLEQLKSSFEPSVQTGDFEQEVHIHTNDLREFAIRVCSSDVERRIVQEWMDGSHVAEISSDTGLSEDAVRKRLSRFRVKAREAQARENRRVLKMIKRDNIN